MKFFVINNRIERAYFHFLLKAKHESYDIIMATATATKRIITEIGQLQQLTDKFILDQSPLDGSSSNIILGRVLPQLEVFRQGAFSIEIKLTNDYPFKPPEVRFISYIYHPNVNTENGDICLSKILSTENYKPTTSLVDIINAIVDIIDHPDLDHALNPGI